MLERILTIGIGAAAPLIGVILRRSRRNRLREQVETYTDLAAKVSDHDAETARIFRELVSETASVLVEIERRTLSRRFDVASFFAIIFFVGPVAALFIWAWGRHGAWVWPVLVASAIWMTLWGIYGLTQLWTQPDEAAVANSADSTG